MTSEVVRVMNLYLSKKEGKKDDAAERFRRVLAPVTRLYLYRNTSEAINTRNLRSELFVGLPEQDLTYGALMIELLRVLEMQDERLTKSWEKRQAIAGSIRKFLGTYAKENPADPAAEQLSKLEIKAMMELW